MTYPNVPITQTPDWVRRAGQAINYLLNNPGGSGTTTNLLTLNTTGGAAPGATFNGSVAITADYHTVGAQQSNANLTAYAGANWTAGTQVPALTAANTVTLKTVGTASGNILDKASGDSLYQPLDSDLTALAVNSTNGLWARTGTGTGAARTITGPAAGITISNGDGVAGNPTLALANDLAALEGLSGTDTLYYRSGADTWSAVTISPSLSFSGGVLGIAAGTSFPGSPSANDRYFRTDRGIDYYYDGTRWLSVDDKILAIGLSGDNAASTTQTLPNPWNGVYDIWLEDVTFTTQMTVTGTWSGQAFRFDGSTATGLASAISTTGDAANTQITRITAVNAVVTSANEGFQVNWNRTSGTLRGGCSLRFRLVG